MMEKMLMLIIIGLLLLFAWFKVTKEENKQKMSIFLLFLIGLLLVIYIRWVVYAHSIFASTDESNYLNIFARSYNTPINSLIVSGPGYVLILRTFNSILGIEIINTPALFGTVMFVLYPILMFSLFYVMFRNMKISLIGTLCLMLTSYFIWASLESRPQQIGMLLVILAVVILWRITSESKARPLQVGIFLFLCFTTFITHILSFVSLAVIAAFILIAAYIKNKISLKTTVFIFLFLALMFSLFFMDEFVYSSAYRAVDEILLGSSIQYPLLLGLSPIKTMYLIGTFVVVALMVFVYLLKDKILKVLLRLGKITKRVINKYMVGFLVLGLMLFATAMFLQFYVDRAVYISYYRNSAYLFFLSQMGNLIFGVLYLKGALDVLRSKEKNYRIKFFLTISIFVIVLGLILLPVSFTFPYGSRNWLLRILSYWVIFAAPIVAFEIIYILRKKRPSHQRKRNRSTSVFATGIVIIFVISSLASVVSTSKDPDIYNSELYWDNEDISSIVWTLKNTSNSTLSIINTLSNFTYFSKELYYYKAIEIFSELNGIEDKPILIQDQLVCGSNSDVIYRTNNIIIMRCEQ